MWRDGQTRTPRKQSATMLLGFHDNPALLGSPGTQCFSLMRQTGSFCPFTCVPSSLSPVLVSFSTRAHRGRQQGGRGERGYDCGLCIYFVQCWEGKLLLCALMWDSPDKCEKDCFSNLLICTAVAKSRWPPPHYFCYCFTNTNVCTMSW